MRKTAINCVYKLAKKDEKVVFVGSDLSPNLLGEMKEEFPDRYYMEGIMEMGVVGMAAGLAMEGFKPYVNTISTFLTRRCYEQNVIDLGLHKLPVKLIANGGGYVYAPLGPTHQAIEDFAIMRAIPNMTVTSVCDSDEMERLMEKSKDWNLPLYIRLGKGGDPIISKEHRGFEIGKAIDMIDDYQTKTDVLLISTGIVTNHTQQASLKLMEKGISCRHLHFHTIKPFDSEKLIEAVKKTKILATVEEHTLIGGLSSAVLECLVDNQTPVPKTIRFGIPDKFSENYGSQEMLLKSVGICPENIYKKIYNEC
tara:strand:- start:1049 stop:1978 length:930 start_codon:yes stop_codon:yes gene_type:complete